MRFKSSQNHIYRGVKLIEDVRKVKGCPMSFETILFELASPIAVLTLNRPAKRNAVNAQMLAEIGAVLSDCGDATRALVLCGAQPSFSAGLDLSEHVSRTPLQAMEVSRLWHRITDRIQHGGVPVVAALTGHVIGAGLEIAASCHIRIAEEDCVFSLPEGKRGIFVGGGASVRVSRLIGESRLMEMMLTGRTVAAEEALRIGLVHHIVPKGHSLDRAREIALAVANNAQLSNMMILSALPRIAAMSPAEGMFTESLAVALTQTSNEAPRRMGEFLKRSMPGG